MAVKIRLKRLGKTRAPFYRIVVADSRTKRNGRVIEEIGKYHPTEHPSLIEVNSERAQYWLGVGAQPSEAVVALLKLTGDWGSFSGEGSTENTVKAPEGKAAFVAEENKKPVLKPKADIKAEAAEAKADEAKADDADKANESAAAESAAAESKADDAKAEEAASDDAPAEEPSAATAETEA